MLKNITALLDGKDKFKLFVLFLLDIGSMITSLFGIAVIVPYIFILFDPKEAAVYPVFRHFSGFIPKDSSISYIVMASCIVLMLYALICVYRLVYDYLSSRIMLRMLYKYSRYLLDWYYRRPFEYYATNHSADIMHRYSVAALDLLNGIVVAALELAAQLLTLAVLIILLFALKRVSVLIPVILIALLCLWMYRLTKQKLQFYSEEMNRIGRENSVKLQESLRGIRELRMAGKTDMALGWQIRGQEAAYRYHIKRNLLMGAPNALIDFFTLAMVLTVLLISYMLTGDLKEGMVVLSVSLAAALQIRDTVMGIFGSFNGIRSNAGAYKEVYDELSQAVAAARADKPEDATARPAFNERIELKKVSYHYPDCEEYVLKDFDLCIEKGEMICVSGASGIGKTTLAQLILGFLKPQKGEILIDGQPIDGYGEAYLGLFGYVPQEIFLLDMSIECNIAVEDDETKIDHEKVREALRAAQLLDFVDTLPDGIKTCPGENGVRLSGGQRQRIGIARAIYSGAKILVFDEATSALDEEVQERFLETVEALRGEYTVIMISHRVKSHGRSVIL